MKGYHEIANELKIFKGPVQIIYGAKDKILPKVADTMTKVKADLPQAKIHVLEYEHFPKVIEETFLTI